MRGIAASAALALLACTGVLLATPSETFWINDCGNKALLAGRLLATSFQAIAFDEPAARIDPHGHAFPIAAPFALDTPAGFVSAYPPGYAALAAPFYSLFGPVGLRIPALLGVVACAALMSVWLAASLGAAWAALSGAVLALATPLFFYGVTVWEHSLTVALCLGAVVLVARPGFRRCFAAGWLIASACWLREEVALMGVALAFADCAVQRRPGPAIGMLAGALIPAAGLLLFNSLVYGNPLGVHLAVILGGSPEASGLPAAGELGAVRVLAGVMAGYGRDDLELALLGAAALAAPALGWLAARSRRGVWLIVVGAAVAGLAAWMLGFGRTLAAERPLGELVRYNGLLVQLPLWSLAGLGVARVFGDPAFAGIRVGVLAGLGFLALTVTVGALSGSGYGVHAGMGAHWGPRVLLPAFPAIVAVAVAAVQRGSGAEPRGSAPAMRVAFALLVTAGLVSSVQSVRILAAQKSDARSFEAALRAQPARYVLTTHPMLAQQLAGLWHERPMLLARDAGGLENVLNGLRDAREEAFSLVVPPGGAALSGIDGLACRIAARHRGPQLHYFDLDIQHCAFRRSGRRGSRR